MMPSYAQMMRKGYALNDVVEHANCWLRKRTLHPTGCFLSWPTSCAQDVISPTVIYRLFGSFLQRFSSICTTMQLHSLLWASIALCHAAVILRRQSACIVLVQVLKRALGFSVLTINSVADFCYQ